MTINYKYVTVGVLILTSFALGRYTSKSVTTTQVTQKQTVDTKVNQDSKVDDHKTVVTDTKTIKPDGTKIDQVTTVTDNKVSNTITDSKTDSVTDTKTDSKTTTGGSSGGGLIISGAIGLDLRNNGNQVYGLEISNTLVGPIRLGIMGLGNASTAIGLVTLGVQL